MKDDNKWRIMRCRNNKNAFWYALLLYSGHCNLHMYGFTNSIWIGTAYENQQQQQLPMPFRIIDTRSIFLFFFSKKDFAKRNYFCQPNNMNVSVRNIPFRKEIRIIGGESVRIHAIYTCMWIDNIFCTTKMLIVGCSGTYNWWNSTVEVNGAT